MQIQQLRAQLRRHSSNTRAKIYARFFKTGKGEYGEGDKFFGIGMPQLHVLAKEYAQLSLRAISVFLQSPWHEARTIALLILIRQFECGNSKLQTSIYRFYLAHARCINNWDLVDISAYKIVGRYLLLHPRKILYKLVQSKNLWERRIAIIATMEFIAHGDFSDTLRISKILLADKHELIHKAVGWMLREVGKRNTPQLERFLIKNVRYMPRTTLRYAIERFPASKRDKYLNTPRR